MNKLNRLIMNESVESRPQSLMGWEGPRGGGRPNPTLSLTPITNSQILQFKIKKRKLK